MNIVFELNEFSQIMKFVSNRDRFSGSTSWKQILCYEPLVNDGYLFVSNSRFITILIYDRNETIGKLDVCESLQFFYLMLR